MIKLNGKIVKQEHFPDNSLRIELIPDYYSGLLSFNEEEYVIETMIKTRKVTVNVKRHLTNLMWSSLNDSNDPYFLIWADIRFLAAITSGNLSILGNLYVAFGGFVKS
mgnify:CR=1 FL=1